MYNRLSLSLGVCIVLILMLTSCGSTQVTPWERAVEALRVNEASKQALMNEELADLFVYYDQTHFWIYRLKGLEPHAVPMTRKDLEIQLDIHLSQRNLVVVLLSKALQAGKDHKQEVNEISTYFQELGFRRLSIHMASGKPDRSIYKEIRLE